MQMKKGFTLLELIIVMAIIGILSSVGVFSYVGSLTHARDAKRKADIKEIQTALELYKQDTGSYPTTAGWLTSVNADSAGAWIPALNSSYIKNMPIDPKNTAADSSSGPDKKGNYIYGYYSVTGLCPGLNAGDYYILAARLEDATDKTAAPIIVTSGCSWGGSPVFAVTNP